MGKSKTRSMKMKYVPLEYSNYGMNNVIKSDQA